MKSVVETQQLVIDDLKAQLKAAESKMEQIRYPIRHTIYVHTSKDDLYEDASTLKLTDDQTQNFIYTGSEIEIDGEVDKDGHFHATHINGVKLAKKVEL